MTPNFEAVLNTITTSVRPESLHHLRALRLELVRAGETARAFALSDAIRVLEQPAKSLRDVRAQRRRRGGGYRSYLLHEAGE